MTEYDEAPLDREAPPIEVRGLISRIGDRTIHDQLDLVVNRGDVVGVVGASGTGKYSSAKISQSLSALISPPNVSVCFCTMPESSICRRRGRSRWRVEDMR